MPAKKFGSSVFIAKPIPNLNQKPQRRTRHRFSLKKAKQSQFFTVEGKEKNQKFQTEAIPQDKKIQGKNGLYWNKKTTKKEKQCLQGLSKGIKALQEGKNERNNINEQERVKQKRNNVIKNAKEMKKQCLLGYERYKKHCEKIKTKRNDNARHNEENEKTNEVKFMMKRMKLNDLVRNKKRRI